MNGKELRSFSHYQILTYIPYLSRKLQNCVTSKFVFIQSEAVKVSQENQIRM